MKLFIYLYFLQVNTIDHRSEPLFDQQRRRARFWPELFP